MNRGLILEIAGGDRWFSAIYVEDLAEGLWAAARSPNTAGRVYFLAHHAPVTWQWATGCHRGEKIMGRRPRTLRVPVGGGSWGRVFERNVVAYLAESCYHLAREGRGSQLPVLDL